jgi:hypothetical protein
MVFEDGTPSRMLTKEGSGVLNREEAMAAIVDEGWLKQPVWYKLYKTELIRHISFPVGKCHEDVFWTYQAVGNAAKVSVFDTPCYFYTQRPGSIMGEGYSLKRLDGLEAKVLRLEFLKEKHPNLVPQAQTDLLFSCMYAMQMSLRHLTGTELAIAKEKILSIATHLSVKFDHLTAKQWVWVLFSRISFVAICGLRNFLKIGL